MSAPSHHLPLVLCNHPEQRRASALLAEQLGVALLFNINPRDLSQPDFAVVYDAQGVSLQHTGRKVPGPICADFVSGAVNHRRRFGGGKGQMIAKAVGVKAGVYPSVLDATAGLGRDGFVLATLGCQVQLLERSPIVYALLADGLARAGNTGDVALDNIVARMQLLHSDAGDYLADERTRADVVYLDPMFPERRKSADVKKSMRAFHHIVGSDTDADQLLAHAIARAEYRVVVKRPRKAPDLAGRAPSYRLEGKANRFDIYTRKKLPSSLPVNEP